MCRDIYNWNIIECDVEQPANWNTRPTPLPEKLVHLLKVPVAQFIGAIPGGGGGVVVLQKLHCFSNIESYFRYFFAVI